jgi:glycosyltransferase involved in cell wall biosynthesis
MKIAHVMRRLSFDDWGGTEQVVWNLAKAQKAAGHDVRIFATTALWRGGDSATKNTKNTKKTLWPLCSLWQRKGPSIENVEGLEILRFRPIYPWWPMPKRLVDELDRKGGNPFVPGLRKALRDWRPDVIHCHAMARIAELCLRTARKIGAKCAISLHGGGANIPGEEAKSLKAPTRGRVPWGKLIDYALGWTRRIPEDADGIVCVGEDEAEKYKTRHPHVLFLPNGVDTSLFAKPETGNQKPETGNQKPATLLCVARIDRQKSQMMLVELLARHPGATLRLVGPVTQPDYLSELEARATALGVADRLTVVGALKPASPELVREYRKADVFILPSRHEPFGIVVLEAWAAGVPVIASDVGGLGRLCAAHPGAALTFPCGDQDALEKAFARLMSDTPLRESLSNAGKTAAATYDWQNLAAKLIGFYGQI